MTDQTKQTSWKEQAEKFYNWYKALGGDTSNNEQMQNAFLKIKA